MDEISLIYATGAVVAIYFLAHVIAGKFDPFAPIWLFLVGYIHVYFIQALSYHEWAVSVRGNDLVQAANLRALWAIAWMLFVYQLGIGRVLASFLPRPPARWSATQVA